MKTQLTEHSECKLLSEFTPHPDNWVWGSIRTNRERFGEERLTSLALRKSCAH